MSKKSSRWQWRSSEMWKRRGFCWWQGGVGWVEWWGRGTESQWKKPTESLFFFFGYFSCLWNWGIPSRSSSPPPYKMILGFFFPPTNLKSCKVLVKTITNYCGKKSPACLTDWLTTQVENEVHNISIMPWHYITVQVEHIMLSFIVLDTCRSMRRFRWRLVQSKWPHAQPHNACPKG